MGTNVNLCCGPKRIHRPARLQVSCPACQDRGYTVNNLTIRSLIRDELIAQVGDVDYNACRNADCEVVYYRRHRDTFRTFSKADLERTCFV